MRWLISWNEKSKTCKVRLLLPIVRFLNDWRILSSNFRCQWVITKACDRRSLNSTTLLRKKTRMRNVSLLVLRLRCDLTNVLWILMSIMQEWLTCETILFIKNRSFRILLINSKRSLMNLKEDCIELNKSLMVALCTKIWGSHMKLMNSFHITRSWRTISEESMEINWSPKMISSIHWASKIVNFRTL